MTIRQLIDQLNYHTNLYEKGVPQISDKEWDDMYFQLKELEEQTGTIYPDSPTQKINYQIVSELKKVKHNHPMLSLDKTKDIETINSFVKNKEWIAMAKMDGLTCSLRFINGELVGAETRGNGEEGEDILHNAKVISNIPQKINYKDELIIDGEIICTYKNFENFNTEYKNPRNFASGSIRLLDSKECKKRKLAFIAWDVIKGFNKESLSDNLIELRLEGFTTVPLTIKNAITLDIESAIDLLKTQCKAESYPIDGIVFKYNNINEYRAAGRTDHHFKGGLAYKFYDETYPTTLKYINWTMGRTGVLTPVAVFDPIDIEGSMVEKASLHNASVMKDLLGYYPYVGEKLQVFKANMIIPQIAEAGPKWDYASIIKNCEAVLLIPETCPFCDKETQLITSKDNVTNLYCMNPQCPEKLINRLDHFCGKKGLDIKGLSKATFEKLIDWGWLNQLEDIFNLNNYKKEWINKAGFGLASVTKILQSIETSKNTTLEAFISAIGIPLIGQANAKELTKIFKTYKDFRAAIEDQTYTFENIYGFGSEMNESLKNFDYTEADKLSSYLIFTKEENGKNKNKLNGMNIVITGKLTEFKNRDELKKIIEENGGRVISSISQKTTLLINNDINSTSSKNLFAKKHDIPIITEQQFISEYL